MDRQFPQFLDPLEWNLIRRDNLVATQFLDGRAHVPIPPRNFGCERHVLIVGVKTTIPQGRRWKFGGRVEMQSFQTPSSTTVFQPSGLVLLASQPLKVNVLTLIVFPKLGSIPYLCQVQIPEWFKDAIVEVWEYGGEDISTFDRLNQLQ